MTLAKVREWQAVAAVAAAVVGVAPAGAMGTAEKSQHGYQTECAAPRIDVGARTCSYTFFYSGNIETFVVPPTTEPVRITAVGAPGAGAKGMQSRGATVTSTLVIGIPLRNC